LKKKPEEEILVMGFWELLEKKHSIREQKKNTGFSA